LTNLSHSKLLDLLSEVNSPHIDLGPALGLSHPLLAEVDDLNKLVQHESPSFKLSYENAFLTAQPLGPLRQFNGASISIGIKL